MERRSEKGTARISKIDPAHSVNWSGLSQFIAHTIPGETKIFRDGDVLFVTGEKQAIETFVAEQRSATEILLNVEMVNNQ